METRYEAYSNMHPYGTEGTVSKVTKNNKEYVLVSALSYVIDDYDEYIDSVELSHYEELGYDIVKAVDVVDVDENSDLLDFTWMKSGDVIDLEESPLNQQIKRIDLNIDNLEYITLPIGEGQLQNIRVKLQSPYQKNNIIKTIKSVYKFLSSYGNEITEGIELVGLSAPIAQIITAIAKKYNVEIKSDEIIRTR